MAGPEKYYDTGNGMSDAPKQTVFGAINDRDNFARMLAEKASQLADRLCGAGPGEPMGKSAPAPVLNGLFEEAMQSITSLSYSLERIDGALSRIERKLP